MSEPEFVCATREEAIGHAMREAGSGGVVVVHKEYCTSRDGTTNCTCEPFTLLAQRGDA